MTSKSVSVTTFYYLVYHPLLSTTAWVRQGMLYTRDSQYSWVISMSQTSLIACLSFSMLNDCLYATLSFTIVHRFSTGFLSGLFPGHSDTEILVFFRKSVSTFDRWQGAPSCEKIVERLETVLEHIYVLLNCKTARIFLLFGVHFSTCLIEQSSLGAVFRGWPYFLSWNVPSALNLTLALGIAVYGQWDLAAMSL